MALAGFSWPAVLALFPNGAPSLSADIMSCVKEGRSTAVPVTATEAMKGLYVPLWLSAGDPPSDA